MCRCWSWWWSQTKSTTMSTPRLTNSLKLTVEPPFLGYPYFDSGGKFFGRNESSFIAFASLARFTEITRHNIVIYFPHINPYEILSRVSLTVNEGSPHTPHPCGNCYLTSNSNEHIHYGKIFHLVSCWIGCGLFLLFFKSLSIVSVPAGVLTERKAMAGGAVGRR